MSTLEERLKELEEKTAEKARKGIIYCEAWYVDMQLAADEVERNLDAGLKIEDFVPDMYEEGYDMEVFEE